MFQALRGLVAISENQFYVATRNHLFQFDATTWARAPAIALAVLERGAQEVKGQQVGDAPRVTVYWGSAGSRR